MASTMVLFNQEADRQNKDYELCVHFTKNIYRSVKKLKTFVNKLLYIFDSNMVCMLHHSATSFTIRYLSTTVQFPKLFS